MAASLLAHALSAEPPPLNELEVVSAGVAAYSGDCASENSARALQKVGLDLSHHRSRPLTTQLLDSALAVLVMTESHRQRVRSLQLNEGNHPPVILFRERMGGNHVAEVPDPYGADLAAYVETRDALMEAVPSLVAWLRQQVEEQA